MAKTLDTVRERERESYTLVNKIEIIKNIDCQSYVHF